MKLVRNIRHQSGDHCSAAHRQRGDLYRLGMSTYLLEHFDSRPEDEVAEEELVPAGDCGGKVPEGECGDVVVRVWPVSGGSDDDGDDVEDEGGCEELQTGGERPSRQAM